MPKMHQNTFGRRAPPGPAGGSLSAPQTPQPQSRGPTFKGRDISVDYIASGRHNLTEIQAYSPAFQCWPKKLVLADRPRFRLDADLYYSETSVLYGALALQIRETPRYVSTQQPRLLWEMTVVTLLHKLQHDRVQKNSCQLRTITSPFFELQKPTFDQSVQCLSKQFGVGTQVYQIR